jgi:hypothetical protein
LEAFGNGFSGELSLCKPGDEREALLATDFVVFGEADQPQQSF